MHRMGRDNLTEVAEISLCGITNKYTMFVFRKI